MELTAVVHSADLRGLDSPEAEVAFLDYLTREEWAELGAIRLRKRYREYLGGRVLARTALCAWTGITPDACTILKEASGRPYSVSRSGGVMPALSLSHAGDQVLCALCQPGMIGVDAECIAPRDVEGLARHVCADSERTLLDQSPDDTARLLLFYRLWTLKEALSKALGTGLSSPLRRLVFEPRDAEFALRPGTLASGAARFVEFTPAPGMVAALAVLQPDDFQLRVEYRTLAVPGRLTAAAPAP